MSNDNACSALRTRCFCSAHWLSNSWEAEHGSAAGIVFGHSLPWCARVLDEVKPVGVQLASVCELNEALCSSDRDIRVAEFLPALSRSIEQAFGDKVTFETVVDDDTTLNHRHARCLGLIFSEAVMNALKHGFRDMPSGRIRTIFSKISAGFEMVVDDNGVGFEPPASVSGHGLGYMHELANQIEGELKFERLQPGARVRLTFRLPEVAP